MKTLKIFIIVALMSIFASVSFAKEIKVRFQWIPNSEPTMKQYVLYSRVGGQGYNYDIPVRIIPCTVAVDGKCLTETTVDGDCQSKPVPFDVPEGQKVKTLFVLRAESVDGEQSGDSNEVFADIDLTPMLAISDLTAVFNKTSQTIDFVWTQPSLDRVKHWDLYSSGVSGGPWNKITQVDVSTTPTASIPADTVAPGTQTFFAVVAFADYDIFSLNSNEVVIDRRPPAKVILKIFLIK